MIALVWWTDITYGVIYKIIDRVQTQPINGRRGSSLMCLERHSGWTSPPVVFSGGKEKRMPVKPARRCRNPHCPNLITFTSGHCPLHRFATLSVIPGASRNRKGSPSSRSYGFEWQHIRRAALEPASPRDSGASTPSTTTLSTIPKKEPDHRKYTLIPRLHGDHSSKTNREDGEGSRLLQGLKRRPCGLLKVSRYGFEG